MAYSKNKNPKFSQPRRARLRARQIPESDIIAKNTILSVIILVMLIVVLALFFQFITNPERIAKQNLEDIAKNYYEDYLYETILGANSSDIESGTKNLAEIMERYSEVGFAKVTLRQLIIFSNEKNLNLSSALVTSCDENETYIRIFPESPYDKTDYRIEYSYSCAF